MTVKREFTELLNIPAVEISDYISKALSEKKTFYSYIKTVQHDDEFETTIKPTGWPFVLSTKMNITFAKKGEQTEVVIRTTSQRFVFGDAFNMYNNYIKNFLYDFHKYS